jgi:hypothetical protein
LGATDDEFLTLVERTNPRLSDSVRQVRSALDHPVVPQQFSLAGTALDKIERALTRDETPSPRT